MGIAHITNWVSPRRCSELKYSGVGADKHVSVIRASTTIINPERVVDRNVATRGSAKAGLSCCEAEKGEDKLND